VTTAESVVALPVLDAGGLRARKKVQTRQALVDAAIDLFDAQGYERTTIEEISAAVGVSARTFHRYFPRKEDVVLADGADRLDRLRIGLTAQLGAASPLAAVRAAVPGTVLARRSTPDSARAWRQLHARRRMMSATPALRALNVAVHDEWVATIAAHAAVMVGEDAEDRWPALFGECTVAAIATAVQRWWRDPAVVLGDEYDAVLDLLSPIDRPSVLVSRSNTPSKIKESTPWTTD
jgi:AcrR family transcriptional regulator